MDSQARSPDPTQAGDLEGRVGRLDVVGDRGGQRRPPSGRLQRVDLKQRRPLCDGEARGPLELVDIVLGEREQEPERHPGLPNGSQAPQHPLEGARMGPHQVVLLGGPVQAHCQQVQVRRELR